MDARLPKARLDVPSAGRVALPEGVPETAFAAAAPRPRPLSDEAFRFVVDAWEGPELCTQSPARGPPAGSTIRLVLEIGAEGRVLHAEAKDARGADERALAACLEARTRTLAFPPAPGGLGPVVREAAFIF